MKKVQQKDVRDAVMEKERAIKGDQPLGSKRASQERQGLIGRH